MIDSCSLHLIKILLFVFNLVFWLIGIAIIAVGAVALSGLQDLDIFVDNKLIISLPIILLVVGSVIFIVSFFGCFGTWKETKWMLNTFIGFLVVILILEITVGICAAVYKSSFDENLHQLMEDLLQQAKNGSQTEIGAWDYIQETLECCGVDNAGDWGNTPTSCGLYNSGCYQALVDFISDQSNVLLGITFGFFVVEIVGILFAYLLARQL